MTSVDAVTAISAILAEHSCRATWTGYDYDKATGPGPLMHRWACKCRATGPNGGRAAHRAHVASLLADLMADGLAKAWSEGYAEGIIHMGMSIEDHGKQPGNPYRRTPEGETRE